MSIYYSFKFILYLGGLGYKNTIWIKNKQQVCDLYIYENLDISMEY